MFGSDETQDLHVESSLNTDTYIQFSMGAKSLLVIRIIGLTWSHTIRILVYVPASIIPIVP